MRLAIVADWLPTYGGAEHVIAAFHSMWPSAPIFTSIAARENLGPLANADIRELPLLQRVFRLLGRHQYLLPFMPRAFEGIDLTGYDVVLSSSHAVAKGIIPSALSVHVCYCHTPMRYAWEMEAQYLKDFRLKGFLKKKVRSELKRIRRWDLTTAQRTDHFIANSTETQQRIARIYGRESSVVSPPVDDRFFAQPITENDGRYLLALGRLVPYKRFDLLIEAANILKLPLKIGGIGSDEARLKALAGPTVEFLGYVPDDRLPALYAGASYLLFPQVEDAGIVPMEAQACGVPVIAFAQGGALDSVQDGITGMLVRSQTAEAFVDAIKKGSNTRFDRTTIRTNAARFSRKTFEEKMKNEIRKACEKYSRSVPVSAKK